MLVACRISTALQIARGLAALGALVSLATLGQAPVIAQAGAATVRVSIASDGGQGLGPSYEPSISSDGRYVAFHTDGPGLVTGDQPPADILVHDRIAHITTPISISASGSPANGRSYDPAISGNGRYVAFDSYATNLVSGDTNNTADVFVYDRQTKQPVRVSVTSAGVEADRFSASSALSADGRYVVFRSQAGNLAGGGTAGFDHVFVHDRDTDVDGIFDEPGAISTTRASVASDGTPAGGGSSAPAISADGRVVAFISSAQNLVGGTTKELYNVFVHDMTTGQTIRVSDDSQGPMSGPYNTPSLSADGRFIAFGRRLGIFVYDRVAGRATLVSVASDGTPGQENTSFLPSLSADGRQVIFQSSAHNLVGDVAEYNSAVFAHDRDTDVDGIFDEPGAISTRFIASGSVAFATLHFEMDPVVSASGRYIAFTSESDSLADGDTNAVADVFLHDQQAIQFSAAAYEVDERAGRAVVAVNLSVPTAELVTVHYATSDGSALAGSDYSATSGTLQFGPGTSSARFSIAIADDAQSEYRETIDLTLTDPTNASLGPRDHATLTILASECADYTADGVLGQADFISNQANRAGPPTAASLNSPTGVAVAQDSGRLFVADSSNNRVVSWPSAAAFASGGPADLVIGQPDFASVQMNQGGTAGATTLSNPFSIAVDAAGHLYVADSGNNRVLMYAAPFSSGMAAGRVFGQPNFTSVTSNQGGAPGANTLAFPINVIADGTRAIYVADNSSRVLMYDAPLSGDANADLVLGQVDFSSAGPNQGKLAPDATTLSQPDGMALDSAGTLYVADTGNNRVLAYLAPRTTDRAADLVLGQPNFTTPDSFNTSGLRANTFALPYGIALDPQGALYVADYNNNRVVVYGPPFSTDRVADRAFGQSGALESGAPNLGGVSATSLNAPVSIALDDQQNVYVADRQNHRILMYQRMASASSPRVTSVEPLAAPIAISFTLKAAGAGFVDGAAIRINGNAQPATFVSSGQLSATIDAQSQLTIGPAAVTVMNPDSCTGVSNAATLTITPQQRYLPLIEK